MNSCLKFSYLNALATIFALFAIVFSPVFGFSHSLSNNSFFSVSPYLNQFGSSSQFICLSLSNLAFWSFFDNPSNTLCEKLAWASMETLFLSVSYLLLNIMLFYFVWDILSYLI